MNGPLPPVTAIDWPQAYRIINSRFPPINLFEDIAADPTDWELLASAEQKTNPRLHENIGNLALVPPERRVAGPGASWVMAPFVHASPKRPGRFHDGTSGAYYAGNRYEVALFETIYHHESFMRATAEPPATATFRELIGAVKTDLYDITGGGFEACLDPESYAASHQLAATLRAQNANGITYPSVRYPAGRCIAAFFPDIITPPSQARHLSYHWNGNRVDYVTDLTGGDLFRVVN